MYKHRVKVYVYIYEKVLQKIGLETSSEARSLLGKIIIQKILKISAFSIHVSSSNGAHDSTSLLEPPYVVAY